MDTKGIQGMEEVAVIDGSKRAFFRHPNAIPLQFRPSPDETAHGSLQNGVFGGIRFNSDHRVAPHTTITIEFPNLETHEKVHVLVLWCERANDSRWEIGAAFLSEEDRFRTRMAEQLCQIELYRQHLEQQEGHPVASEEAARQWVARHASEFPS